MERKGNIFFNNSLPKKIVCSCIEKIVSHRFDFTLDYLKINSFGRVTWQFNNDPSCCIEALVHYDFITHSIHHYGELFRVCDYNGEKMEIQLPDKISSVKIVGYKELSDSQKINREFITQVSEIFDALERFFICQNCFLNYSTIQFLEKQIPIMKKKVKKENEKIVSSFKCENCNFQYTQCKNCKEEYGILTLDSISDKTKYYGDTCSQCKKYFCSTCKDVEQEDRMDLFYEDEKLYWICEDCNSFESTLSLSFPILSLEKEIANEKQDDDDIPIFFGFSEQKNKITRYFPIIKKEIKKK
jgi:hypothetical protein